MTRPDRAARNRAATHPDADDPRLRGAEYALPFGAVWKAALGVAASSRGWTVTSTDPRSGEIVAEARTSVWKFTDDVEVRVTLDRAGLTRVDVRSASRAGSYDFGANARRIGRFVRRLNRELGIG